MSRESDSRRSSGSSHHVVNVGTTEGIAFCIFRAPPSLSEVNQKAYQPKIVPIGPYHHGEPHFRKIQKHKQRFFTDLLHRTNQPTHKLEYFTKALESEENKIRRCYSEELDFKGDKLIEMMVLDGCFIIELFCKYKRKSQSHTHPKQDPLLTEDPKQDPLFTEDLMQDPLLTEEWRLPVLMQDLAKLENQIPWSVLECLFNLTLGPSNERYPSLFNLALSFFNRMLQRPNNVLQKDSDKEAKHLLHLLLLTYDGPPPRKREENKFLHLIQPANKLHQAGIKFKPKHCESFMDIKFSDGVLEIPVLKFDDFLSCLFLNFIAFEQCHRGSSKHVTAYATFMACLLNTPADAEFLCNRKIIERYFGTDEKIAHFFSNIGKDVVFDIRKNHLSQVFEDVNVYCETDFRVYWASFKNTYFKSRWYLISAIVASILLVLSAIQSSYAVIAYYRPSS